MSKTIGIAGLGLIGGSMAQALKKYTGHLVLGTDLDADVLRRALSEGAVDGALEDDAVSRCDLLLVALYPQAAVDFVTSHAQTIKKGACVIDLCGVKRHVCAALEPVARAHGFHFIGGHPMAGREVSGYGAARPELFAGASMILTPEAGTPEALLEQLESLFTSVGFAGIKYAGPAEHDRIIACTSQLAHVLSSAYVKSPAALEHKGFSAGSFQDMTRVATLNEDMWSELFLLNRDYLCGEIDALRERLAQYALALRAGDAPELTRLLKEGKTRKQQLS
ncbi:MAG: prephenate dehydrogenase [Christensenellales bacterium]|jgi:prephenate dehydrogenase